MPMYQRIVCFKFKPDTSADDKQRHMRAFAQLKNSIPEIRDYAAGSVVQQEKTAYDTMHYLIFETLADIDIYHDHPAHMAFVQQFRPYWDNVLVLNAEIETD